MDPLWAKSVKESFQSVTASQDWPEALRGKKSQRSSNDMAERNCAQLEVPYTHL